MKRIALTLVLTLCSLSSFANRSVMAVTARSMLVMMPDVKKELKVTKDQEKAILAAQKQSADDMRDGKASIDLTNPMASFDGSLTTILGDAQKQRLNELYVQYNGGFALADAPTADALALTDDQRVQVNQIYTDANSQMMDKLRTAHSEGAIKAVQKLRDSFSDKLKALLTPDQAKKFGEIQGKPFKFKS